MQLLLAEDEVGILDGLATILRRHGHVVRAAADCATALGYLARERFDALVTDWRLGDGSGADLLAVTAIPSVVMSGWPDEVSTSDSGCTVLTKPVRPSTLLDALAEIAEAGEDIGRATTPTFGAEPTAPENPALGEPALEEPALGEPTPAGSACAGSATGVSATGVSATGVSTTGASSGGHALHSGSVALPDSASLPDLASLPADCRIRLELVFAILREEQMDWFDATCTDDGSMVRMTVDVAAEPAAVEAACELLETVVSEFRIRAADGRARIELRAWRNGCPADVETVLGLGDAWPIDPDQPFAIRCDGLSPRRGLDWISAVARLRRAGRVVHLLDLPDAVRLLAETQGLGADLPMRTTAGPRLPPVLEALWNEPPHGAADPRRRLPVPP